MELIKHPSWVHHNDGRNNIRRNENRAVSAVVTRNGESILIAPVQILSNQRAKYRYLYTVYDWCLDNLARLL